MIRVKSFHGWISIIKINDQGKVKLNKNSVYRQESDVSLIEVFQPYEAEFTDKNKTFQFFGKD